MDFRRRFAVPCFFADDGKMLGLLLLAGGSVLFVALATVMAGRLAWARSGTRNPESVGFIGAILNGLFIVVLAFYTVLGWEDSGALDDHTTGEADALVNVYWNTQIVPQPQRDRIRTLIRDYATEVVEREWPRHVQGGSDPQADRLLTAVRTEVLRLPSTPEEVKTARDNSLSLLAEATNHREQRIAQAAADDDMARLLFIGTVAGAIAMVCFPILIGLTGSVRNVVAMAVMAGALALTCYGAFDIVHPFDGWVGVDADTFQHTLQRFSTIP